LQICEIYISEIWILDFGFGVHTFHHCVYAFGVYANALHWCIMYMHLGVGEGGIKRPSRVRRTTDYPGQTSAGICFKTSLVPLFGGAPVAHVGSRR